jgi:phosphoribosylanthranilate isomerase
MQLVKICKVNDIHTARLCGDLGVDFIGLHAIQGVECETSATYASIVRELEQGYPDTTPVLVTKVIEPDQLSQMLTSTSVAWVQLHVPLTSTQATYIREAVGNRAGKKIKFMITVAVSDPDATTRVLGLAPIADCILLDSSYEGGTGIEANLATMTELVRLAFPTPVLIAGGITSKNAKVFLEATRANGVDVQSGVQTDEFSKNKDPLLIAELVSSTRNVKVHTKLGQYLARAKSQRLVSLAVTSVDDDKLDETLLRFRHTPVDLVHTDFSDRTIAPRFEANPLPALARLRHLIPCMPYDVHFFIHDTVTQRSIISACKQLNPLLRLVFLHVRGPHDVSESLFDSIASLCNDLELDFGFSIQLDFIHFVDRNEKAE